ncbi:MAG: outer membrane protein transport protein [Betaproteobacteria bacterium]
MKTVVFRRARVAAALGAAGLALATGHSLGAAFALQESNGSGVGNAFAGGAAAAEDASTIWSNPAGMSKLDRMQVVSGIDIVTPSIKFRNGSSAAAAFQPLGGDGGDAGSVNFVPFAYFSVPLSRQFSFGVGLNAPFGLVTEYDNNWLGRFQGLKSDIKTINVNPAVSWRVNDQFAVGAGVNWQKIDATFTSQVNYSAGLAQAAGTAAAQGLIPAALVPTIIAATPGLESHSDVNGDDSAWGWNVGMLWDVTPATRVGAHYRSSIKYKITGNVSFDNPALPALPPALAPVVGLLANNVNARLANGGFTSNVELPDIANVSIFTRINPKWDVMADAQWTHWSVVKDLTFVRTTGVVLQSTPENFDDAWRVSVGANYHHNDQWMFRGGLAWDKTPVIFADRTVRLPDEDRIWFSVGAQYKLNSNLKFDGGFTYIKSSNANISQNAGSQAANGFVDGKYDASVTIFGLQATYTF